MTNVAEFKTAKVNELKERKGTMNTQSDKEFFSLLDECRKVVDQSVEVWKKATATREKANLDPTCPKLSDSHEANKKHWEKYGLNELYDQGNALDKRARALTWALFNTSPETHEGLLAKIKFQKHLQDHIDEDTLAGWLHSDHIWYCLEQDIAGLTPATKGSTAPQSEKNDTQARAWHFVCGSEGDLHDIRRIVQMMENAESEDEEEHFIYLWDCLRGHLRAIFKNFDEFNGKVSKEAEATPEIRQAA